MITLQLVEDHGDHKVYAAVDENGNVVGRNDVYPPIPRRIIHTSAKRVVTWWEPSDRPVVYQTCAKGEVGQIDATIPVLFPDGFDPATATIQEIVAALSVTGSLDHIFKSAVLLEDHACANHLDDVSLAPVVAAVMEAMPDNGLSALRDEAFTQAAGTTPA